MGDDIIEDIVDAELIMNDGLMGIVEAEIINDVIFDDNSDIL